MHFRLNTFHGYETYLRHFLSHRNTPKDQITSISVFSSFSENYLLASPEDESHASFRAVVNALSGLKEVSIPVKETMTKQERVASVERYKRLLGLDREGVVLTTH